MSATETLQGPPQAEETAGFEDLSPSDQAGRVSRELRASIEEARITTGFQEGRGNSVLQSSRTAC